MKNKSLGFLELFPTRLIPVVPGSVWSPRPPARFLTVGDGIRSLFAYDAAMVGSSDRQPMFTCCVRCRLLERGMRCLLSGGKTTRISCSE